MRASAPTGTAKDFADPVGADAFVGPPFFSAPEFYTRAAAQSSPSVCTASSRILYFRIFPAAFMGKLSTKRT